MRAEVVPHQRMIDPESRFELLAARRQIGSADVRGDVPAGLREMLELAQRGGQELRVVGDIGLPVVVPCRGLRLALVVEISDLSQRLRPAQQLT